VDWAALEESAGVSLAGLSVGAVEFVFGVDPVFVEDIGIAFDDDEVGCGWRCFVGSDAVASGVLSK
jgi:hypothetical protein